MVLEWMQSHVLELGPLKAKNFKSQYQRFLNYYVCEFIFIKYVEGRRNRTFVFVIYSKHLQLSVGNAKWSKGHFWQKWFNAEEVFYFSMYILKAVCQVIKRSRLCQIQPTSSASYKFKCFVRAKWSLSPSSTKINNYKKILTLRSRNVWGSVVKKNLYRLIIIDKFALIDYR